jgi:hypothetical protein
VVYLLEARTVEPEKQPLPANGSETTSFLGNGRKTNRGITSVARQQILDKQQLNKKQERCFLWCPCRDVITGTVWGNQSVARVLSWKGAAFQRGLEPGSRGMTIVRSRYQETASGDYDRLRTLGVCFSDLKNVEISDGAIFKCYYELCVKVVSKSSPFIHSSVVLQPFVGPWPVLQFRNHFYTAGKTPWTRDQPVARPLPTHRTTQTE